MTAAGEHVVIVGGGIIGSSVAWFLREEGFVGSITVIERDPSYRFSSTSLSVASIRVQFGTAVNVALSLFGADFLRSIARRLGRDVEIDLVQRGYLILASDAQAAGRDATLAMQAAAGCHIAKLDEAALAERFPWLSLDGVTMATLGLSDEGWFDAWSLLSAMRGAAIARGVTYVTGEAIGFALAGTRISGVRLADGRVLECDWCVNAAGALSGRVGDLLGLKLPVVPRKRSVFHFKAPLNVPDMPMLFDVSGAWIRPEGPGFIAGMTPDADADVDAYDDFEYDIALFEERVWPTLAGRIPALEELRLLHSWAGHYDMNIFDHNAIIGPHPDIANFVLACGFSGHGVMHAPGAARAVAEHIVHREYRTIDVSPLSFERIAAGRPYLEQAIY